MAEGPGTEAATPEPEWIKRLKHVLTLKAGWIEELKPLERILRQELISNLEPMTGALLPAPAEDVIHQIISTCQRQRFHCCLVLIAAACDAVHLVDVKQLKENEFPYTFFVRAVIQYLVDRKNWRHALQLFECWSDVNRKSQWIVTLLDGGDADFVQRWNEQNEGNRLLKELFQDVLRLGFSRTLKLLVSSENEEIQRAIPAAVRESPNILKNLVEKLCVLRQHRRSSERSMSNLEDFKEFFSVACDAGLFTNFVQVQRLARENGELQCSPFQATMRFNQPDLAKRLYYAGATCNHEIFHYNQMLTQGRNHGFQRRLRRERGHIASMPYLRLANLYPTIVDEKTLKKVRTFFSKKASHPSPLQFLCVQEVLTHLGYGRDRATRVDQLPLPVKIKEMLRSKTPLQDMDPDGTGDDAAEN